MRMHTQPSKTWSVRQQGAWRWAFSGLLGLLMSCVTDGTHDVGGDIDVELRPYFRGLRTVEAVVGRDTVPFLFDTGGGVTVISPEVARSIGCAPFGRMVGHRMTGEPVEFQRCDSVEIVVGALELSHSPVAVFDVNALLPAELPRLGGVLSLDSFRGRILLIDWPAGRVTVRDASARAPADFPASLPLRLRPGITGSHLSFSCLSAGRGAHCGCCSTAGTSVAPCLGDTLFGRRWYPSTGSGPS